MSEEERECVGGHVVEGTIMGYTPYVPDGPCRFCQGMVPQMTEDITSTEAAEKAMENRCQECKQMDAFIADSVYFNDGDHTVFDLLEFRKHGFVDRDGKKCACYNRQNKRKRDASNE